MVKKNLHLDTPRLILRRPLQKDAPFMIRYLNDPLISATTLTIPFPYYKQHALDWIRKAQEGWDHQTTFVFAITRKNKNDFIGAMGLHPNPEHNRAEIGYWIAHPFWNKGYATEALIAMLQFGFETVGYHKLFATHMVDNPSSGKVMIKAGMIREGILADHYRKGNRFISVAQYRLTRPEYLKKKLHP